MATIFSRYRKRLTGRLIQYIDRHIATRCAILALVLLLSACTTAPSNRDIITKDVTFSREEAQATIATALETISTKFLHPVKLSDLSVTGLKALARLDQELTVTESHKNLSLHYSGRVLGNFIEPEDRKVEEWAETLVDATIMARKASRKIAAQSQDDIFREILESILQSIDEYSHYSSPNQALSLQAKRHGYGGIGIILDKKNKTMRIENVFPDSPAQAAGLQVDDVLTHVDGKRIQPLSLPEVAKLIRGPVRSHVALRIKRPRDNLNFEVDVERAQVIRPTIEAKNANGVSVVAITGFNKDTATSLKRAIQTAQANIKHPLKGIVLDLRGNPGGLLQQSVRVSDLFIAGGKLVGARGRHPQANRSYRADQVDIAKGVPLVVVVDGKSASASEIVASTLQDRGRAVIIGTTSYGKGTVQTITRLPNGGEMTLTWSRLMPPSGYFYHRLGVLPALCTSTKESPDDKLIEKAIDDGNFTTTLARWRTVEFDDTTGRKELRNACKPEKRTNDTDIKIAIKLIEDEILYESLLSLDTQGQAMAY